MAYCANNQPLSHDLAARLRQEQVSLQQPIVSRPASQRHCASMVVMPSRRDLCGTMQVLRDLLAFTTIVLVARTTSHRTAADSSCVATHSPCAAAETFMFAALVVDATVHHSSEPDSSDANC
ncbi:hypothetical protein D1007_51830 [Hordeum vulgare]|nr:hypothetical protein D1007_51830 [Hordeum vulgare]